MSQAQYFAQEQVAARDQRAGRSDSDPRDSLPILVSDTPPTSKQRGAAWGIVLILSLTFAAAAPFYSVNLTIVPAFVPVINALVCITGVIAAVFLFGQYAVQRQPEFLALACGYLLAGLFAFFQSLAFPNAYSATGLLGGGPSAAAWLFLAWRTSFPLGVLAYIFTRRPTATSNSNRSAGVSIAIAVGCVVVVACAVTWIITFAEPHLPLLFTDATHEASKAPYTTVPAVVLSLAAILLLLVRRRTTLDLWLIVTLIAALPDVIVPVSRFALGFYIARSYELISSCALLIALLTESSTLYTRLASAKTLQAHGDAERLSSVETATAAIAHELRQPLSAVMLNAQAAALLLENSPSPGLEKVREALADIEKDVSRACDVMDRIRGAVCQRNPLVEHIDVNAAVSDAVKLVSDEAMARQVAVTVNLSDESPYVFGDRTQITQVLLNLITNGVDAMESAPAAQRRLVLGIAKQNGSVEISVSDYGCGIRPEHRSRIFDPFFTTRRGGMGLGLSICQSIVLAHKGRLWAENNPDQGATFYISLPTFVGE
jgi:signal transduction histidine kinase